MDKKDVVYFSISSRRAEDSIDLLSLLKEIETMDGVARDTIGQKGIPGADLFAVEVVKAGLFTKLAETIGGWLIKDRRRGLKLKIGENELEVFDMSEAEQEKLIQWFQKQVDSQSKSKNK